MTRKHHFWTSTGPGQAVLLLIAFGLIFLSTACGEVEVDSFWRDRTIIVDGKTDDWLDALYFFEEDNVSAGFFNDSDNLYICFLVEDYSLQNQLIMQGFTLWLDPTGGKEKTFGIKFPLGMMALRGDKLPGTMDREKSDRERMEDMQNARPDPKRIREAFDQTLDELEILGPGDNDRQRLSVEDTEGLKAQVRNKTGLLIYELQIPLQSTGGNSYAVGTTAGALIGVGLEIPKPDRDKMQDMRKAGRDGGMPPGGGQSGGRPPGGGRPGGMGGRRGGMGMPGGRQFRMPDGLKIWARLQLAAGPK